MKKSKLLFAICIAVNIVIQTINSNAQAPVWAWAKSAVGNHTDWPTCITHDSLGYIYVGGYFTSDTLFLGSDSLINYYPHSFGGSTDIFLVKYDQNGNVVWARKAIGPSNQYAYSIAVESSGNIYLACHFYQYIIFGSDTLFNYGSSYSDICIAKFDNGGNVIWLKNYGGNKDDFINSIDVSPSGKLFFTGVFVSQSITFNTITLYNPNWSLGINRGFLASMDSSGNILSAKNICFKCGFKVTFDNLGFRYLYGSFADSILKIGNDTLFNSGGYDAFIAKFNNNGQLVWARNATGLSDETINTLKISSSGNIYLAGVYRSQVMYFDTIALPKVGLNGNWDMFMAKYDSAGNVQWAKRAGEVESEEPTSLNIDNNENSYVSGYFNDTTITFGTVTLNNAGPVYGDIFITKYDSSGNTMWAFNVGNYENDIPFAATLDNSNNLYVTGWYASPTIDFGSTTLSNTGGIGSLGPYQDMFLAKLDATTGILESSTSINPIIIYPNPTNGFFTIKTNSNINSIEVYNVLGEKIYSKNNLQHQTENQINLSISSSGIYFVKVYDGENSFCRKIVIE